MIKNLPCRIENVISEVKGKIYIKVYTGLPFRLE